jgi:hypothetical protein
MRKARNIRQAEISKEKQSMKIRSLVCLIFVTLMSVAIVSMAHGQSTDIDNPTILTANMIEGEGDGKAETFYYWFTALKGDVKVTVDAKSDNYSVILDVVLLDEDGGQLLRIQNVATDVGKREVATKHFVRDQKVIVRVALPKDDHLKLLNYKIKLDGSVKVETPVVPVEATPAQTTVAPTTAPVTAESAAPQTVPDGAQVQTPGSNETTKKPSAKSKIKEKITKEVKKAVKDNVPD